MKYKFLSIFFIIYSISLAQTFEIDLDKNIIGKLDLKYDTYFDLENYYGKGQDTINIKNNLVSKGYLYKDLNVLILRGAKSENQEKYNYLNDVDFDPEGAYIRQIHFYNNSILKFGEKEITVGKSKVKDIIEFMSNVENEFIEDENDITCFYSFLKNNNLKIYTQKVKNKYTFSKDIKDYLNSTITKVEIIHDFNGFEYNSSSNKCERPIYATKNEKHLNCLKKSMRNILKSGTTDVKDGVWKEFHPNHKIKYEGKFEVGKPIGVHKTYKMDGTLEKEENFGWGLKTAQIVVLGMLFVFIIFILYYIFFRNHKRK